MKSSVLLGLGCLLTVSLGSCGFREATSPTRGLPKVVVTNSVLCDLAKQLAQDTVDLTCLISAGTDPHLYAPTPEARKRLETANLILYSGYNLEPALEKLIKASPQNITKVAVSELAVPKPLMGEAHGDHDHGDHNHDDAKSQDTQPTQSPTKDQDKAQADLQADPHVWHNAQNGIAMVKVIGDQLTTANPSQAESYKSRIQILTQQLTSLDSWIKTQVATIPPANRTLVTTHDALGYYSQAYGIAAEPIEGISTEEKPSAARIKEVIDLVRSKKVPAIFAETSINPLVIKTIARDTPVEIAREPIYADGLSTVDSSAGTYQKMMVSNTKALVNNLGGKYEAWRP